MGISGAAVVLMGLLLLAMVVLVAYLALRKSPVPDLLPQLQPALAAVLTQLREENQRCRSSSISSAASWGKTWRKWRKP